jgi:hypothetical protein
VSKRFKLCIEGPRGGIRHYTLSADNTYDAEREAENLADTVYRESDAAWSVHGAGRNKRKPKMIPRRHLK